MSIFQLEKSGAIATITLNRPDSLNALGAEGDGDEIRAICAELSAAAEIRCVILTGAGKAFSAGGDLRAMQAKSGAFSGSPLQVRDGYRHNIHQIITSLYHLELPVVGAINGPAIGLGCDVACLSDVRVASTKARFGATFLKLGLIPGDGGAWLLPRLIGMSRASELLFTGDVIDASTAQEWGLVSYVVEADELMSKAIGIAERIAAMPPQALRSAKSLLRQSAETSLEGILALSAATQALLHQTEDHREGVAALLEKRPPEFKGR